MFTRRRNADPVQERRLRDRVVNVGLVLLLLVTAYLVFRALTG